MRCLLCSEKFDEKSNQNLLQHYIGFHKIDENNWFFKNLFALKKNSKILQKCLRCEDFIYDSQSKAEHDFLNHFAEGKQRPFETKPLDIKILKDKITIYSISFSKHKNDYNFFDSEDCVEDFLNNCRYNFKNSDDQKSFKCSFTIENQQDSPTEGGASSFDYRYWSTTIYEGVYFNDFIYFNLKSEILNRVIQNGQSGSSWYFKRFASLSLKVLKGEVELAI